jgi:hypothetical protein
MSCAIDTATASVSVGAASFGHGAYFPRLLHCMISADSLLTMVAFTRSNSTGTVTRPEYCGSALHSRLSNVPA